MTDPLPPISAERIIQRMTESLAKALHDQAVRKLTKEVELRGYDLKHVIAVFAEAFNESDRSAAILIFALIDDVLEHFLRSEINPGIRGGAQSLFVPLAPLSSADARIQLAAGLYWIGQDVYENIHRLRKVRNTFAHEATVRSFEDDRIANHVKALTNREVALIENAEVGGHVAKLKDPSLRDLFLVRSALTVDRLIAYLMVAPLAVRMGLPTDVLRDYDSAPDNLREVSRTMGRIVLAYVGVEGAQLT